MSKICKNRKGNGCGILKEFKYFVKDKRRKNGITNICLDCKRIYNNKYQYIYRKTEKGKENIKKSKKLFNINNPNYTNTYYKNNKTVRIESIRKYQKTEKGKEMHKNSNKKWRNNNPNYFNDKYNNDLQYNTMVKIRGRLKTYLKLNDISKTNKTIYSIGCSPKELRDWIYFNLNIDNLTEYHLDHLRPLISFNCKNYDEVIKSKCNHWTNIIPTTEEYNLSKSDRPPTKHELFKQELRLYIFNKHLKL